MYVIQSKSCEFGKMWYVSSLSSVGIALTHYLEKALQFDDLGPVHAFMALAAFYPNFEILDFEIMYID